MPDDLHFECIARGALAEDPARAIALATLCWSASPEFYAVISTDKDALLPAIGRQIGEPGFDMPGVLAMRRVTDVGLVAGLDLSLLAAGQMAALVALIKHVPQGARTRFTAEMRRHASGVEPVDAEGHYITRVAVAPVCRGEGLGRAMMCEYLSRFAQAEVHLHVRRDNAAAIALYRSLGFVRRSDADFLYPAFARRP